MGKFKFWRHVIEAVVVLAAAAGWAYVAVNAHRQKDPVVIVKKHFLFYPEYSHGVWTEGPRAAAGAGAGSGTAKGCSDITYTIPVKGCGDVTFDWNVFPGDGDGDADATWKYNPPPTLAGKVQGRRQEVDEAAYPFYAFMGEDARFIDSPALGKAVPEVCAVEKR
jgi:hypothetical protein